MSVQKINNVRISGIAAAVPKNIVENRTCGLFENDEDYRNFVANVGVERRRVAPSLKSRLSSTSEHLCCSDLCQAAAERLMSDLNWEKSEIDLLIYVSQNMDYKLPATACCLQERLGLSKSCMAFDVGMGCSGWVYGLGIIGGMMQTGSFRKALLLAGDANSAPENAKNKGHDTLFGSAGTATALCFDKSAERITIESGTDGSGYDAIICRVGGSRHPVTAADLEWIHDENGHLTRAVSTQMDGPAVFVFGITRVPKCVKNMLSTLGETVDSTDLFLFHQANLMMNERIRTKCKIPTDKCPYSLKDFGNNSSASIPLTIVTQSARQMTQAPCKVCACGFGVGLSWSTMYTCFQQPVISPLVEI